MRNVLAGIGRRDIGIYVGATILMILLTIGWDLFLVETIGTQQLNKYFLTAVLFALAALVAVVSAIAARGSHGFAAALLVRFGLALEIFGIMITPIGLYYATNPTRSVQVGFAAFS